MASDQDMKDTEGHKFSRTADDDAERDAAARSDADEEQDTEGHKASREAWGRGASEEDDTEGHKWARHADADEDDVEGHKIPEKG